MTSDKLCSDVWNQNSMSYVVWNFHSYSLIVAEIIPRNEKPKQNTCKYRIKCLSLYVRKLCIR